MAPQVFLETI